MFNSLGISRGVIVFALCLPLAILLGYLVATPTDMETLGIFGLCLFVLCFPILIKAYHPILIATWNASVIIFFLPGAPMLWMVFAILGLFFALLNRTLTRRNDFIYVPGVTWSLLFILLVVVVVAKLTGGIGIRVLGSATFGGKRYISLFASIIGYFALVSQKIPRERAFLYTSLFFASGVTALASNLAYSLGPSFSFLYALFPSFYASAQAIGEANNLVRLTGVGFAAAATINAMVLIYGIRGLADFRKPWRILIFLGLVGASLLGGFRSILILLGLILLFQFYLEGLFRTRLFPAALVLCALAVMLVVGFVNKMPLSVQRSLSVLPIEVDMRARLDANETLDWRLQMWKVVVPEIPKYFWLGKGFSFSGTDLYLTDEAMKRGYSAGYESSLVNGDYHNGILTIIIPFGIWGILGFMAFSIASLKVLYANYRNGDPYLKPINTFLLSFFCARLVFYVVFYGQFDLDLPGFIGNIALSISLNGGARKQADTELVFAGQALPSPA